MADFLILDDDKKTEVEPQKEKTKESIGIVERLNLLVLSFQKIKTRDKAIFYRLLSTMVNSGISLLKAVSILEKQEKNPLFKRILSFFIVDLKEGKTLSECMSRFPKDFDKAEVGIIRAGEKTGLLNKSLSDLADQIEKLDSISGKIKGALMYPAFIIVVVIIVMIIMMVKVVPNLLEIFMSEDALPASTRILIAISDFFVAHWFMIIVVIVAILVGINIWKKTENGSYMYDNLKMKVPIMGELTQKMVLSKFSRIFSGLIGSGVSIVESLRITAEAVGSEVYKQKILLLSQDVAGGIKIWESIDGDPLFPDMMVQMIQVGEQTAKLDETIAKVADFYDEQVDNVISTLNKLLEPIILVILAVLVGFMALAIMEPIMGLADTVENL